MFTFPMNPQAFQLCIHSQCVVLLRSLPPSPQALPGPTQVALQQHMLEMRQSASLTAAFAATRAAQLGGGLVGAE